MWVGVIYFLVGVGGCDIFLGVCDIFLGGCDIFLGGWVWVGAVFETAL